MVPLSSFSGDTSQVSVVAENSDNSKYFRLENNDLIVQNIPQLPNFVAILY